jgi:hypothetical protein
MDQIEIKSGPACKCEDDCDCMPDIYLEINGSSFGSGVWVEDAKGRRFYSCRMFFWDFEARSKSEAVEIIRRRFRAFRGVDVH